MILVLGLWAAVPGVTRGQETMQRFYLVPIEQIGNSRGPQYFRWRFNPSGIDCRWAMMDYGFVPSGLVLALDITQTDHDALILNSDVFAFPESLAGPVDQDVQTFFEGIHVPTDWLTPATTWIELMRQLAGMFQFNQRYGGIAAEATGELHSIFDSATLDTRLRQMTDDEQGWFLATVESFGFDPGLVSDNARLRQLVRMAGDYWEDQPFMMGGVEF